MFRPSKVIKSIAFIFGVVSLALGLSYFVLAWTEPTAAPPVGNVSAPLNVGNIGQSKVGGLILNTGGAATGLIVQSGAVNLPANQIDSSEVSFNYAGSSSKGGAATTANSVPWGGVSGIPAGFADGVDNTGITSETDPTVLASVKDGISWGEVSGRPAFNGCGGVNLALKTLDLNTGATTCETDDIGGGGVSGSGTANYISKWTGGTSLGNSVIYDNGTNVGIGTASPGAKLDVSGGGIKTGGTGSGALFYGRTTAGMYYFIEPENSAIGVVDTGVYNAGFNNRLNIDASAITLQTRSGGNVGIGTASPGAKLDVRGGLTGIYVDTDANGIYTTSNNNGVYATNNFNGVYATGNTFDFYGTGNSNFGGNVGIGTMGSRSRLDVAGGDISIDNGRTFYSRGRMHIHGEENLYLLNKGGVIVSKAWGGNGNLTVEGSISAGENLTMGSGRVLYSSGRMHIHGEENLYLLNKGGVIVGKEWGGNGNLSVQGNLSVAGIKNFEIDHPTNPGYKLVHSTLEGPEAAVFYRGAARLVNSQTIVELPGYFEDLTRKAGRTVQLTSFGGYSPLYVEGEVKEGKFVVKTTSDGNPNQQFYWEVKAVRADVEPLRVEKPSGQ